MGVPAFFRWLSRKYASIVVHCLEEKAKECNGVGVPVDTSKPNPNEVEFDSLYLDMNGIIHPCTHPEDKAAPKNEDEMMVAVFEYIDRLYNIVRPRKLHYMAVDGVVSMNSFGPTDKPAFLATGQFAPQALGRGGAQPVGNPRHAAFNMRMNGRDQQNMTPSGSRDDGSPSPSGGVKRKAQDSDSEPEPEDNIRYYYQGCASWKWFFSFHYAPFASDFKDIKGMFTEFELGTKPFKPLEQLMSVFPAASGNFLPVSWQALVTEPNSSIIDFYPDDFAIDLNGKKYAWQGVALLSFVDERRLRAALEEVYPDLCPGEIKRNSLGSDILFVGKRHPLRDFMRELYRANTTESVDIPPELCHGIKGALDLDESAILPENIKFKDPQFQKGFVFKAVLLLGAKLPPKVLKPGDWERSSRASIHTGSRSTWISQRFGHWATVCPETDKETVSTAVLHHLERITKEGGGSYHPLCHIQDGSRAFLHGPSPGYNQQYPRWSISLSRIGPTLTLGDHSLTTKASHSAHCSLK
ncbi:5'-3' exoribonuclease 2-like [Polyodon spathula]|uniref:5'-3' exoribonuclease 2-like n=1 Tax=Polyodon spathula TaxID=7913 RepID=UPI001B7EDE81|nr:5'-3' exoribonuclease 2-like [Polyodon spathula]